VGRGAAEPEWIEHERLTQLGAPAQRHPEQVGLD